MATKLVHGSATNEGASKHDAARALLGLTMFSEPAQTLPRPGETSPSLGGGLAAAAASALADLTDLTDPNSGVDWARKMTDVVPTFVGPPAVAPPLPTLYTCTQTLSQECSSSLELLGLTGTPANGDGSSSMIVDAVPCDPAPGPTSGRGVAAGRSAGATQGRGKRSGVHWKVQYQAPKVPPAPAPAPAPALVPAPTVPPAPPQMFAMQPSTQVEQQAVAQSVASQGRKLVWVGGVGRRAKGSTGNSSLSGRGISKTGSASPTTPPSMPTVLHMPMDEANALPAALLPTGTAVAQPQPLQQQQQAPALSQPLRVRVDPPPSRSFKWVSLQPVKTVATSPRSPLMVPVGSAAAGM